MPPDNLSLLPNKWTVGKFTLVIEFELGGSASHSSHSHRVSRCPHRPFSTRTLHMHAHVSSYNPTTLSCTLEDVLSPHGGRSASGSAAQPVLQAIVASILEVEVEVLM